MGTLVFWQNIPSIHQAPLIREVAKRWPGDVCVVAESDVSAARLHQGWLQPDFSPANLLIAPSKHERLEYLGKMGSRADVHIFSGFHAYPETYWTLKRACGTQAILGVFAERGKGGGCVRSILRRLRYVSHALKLGRRLDFLLTPGKLGVDWYSRCFFPTEKIFPFCYSVEPGVLRPTSTRSDVFTFIYVGAFVPWKGVDLLFQALSELTSAKWRLHLVGEGPLRSELSALARTLGIDDRIVWDGVLANSVARQLMADSDLLVLPSRYDGWGAVVNESLTVGTPVVVSDACGASDLIRCFKLGGVFCSQSVNSLKGLLKNQLEQGLVSNTKRRHIQDWAKCIQPSAIAKYLIDIIEGYESKTCTPLPPWWVGR